MPSRSASKSKRKKSSHWQNLERDTRGRWVKRNSKTKKTSKSTSVKRKTTPKPKKTPSVKTQKIEEEHNVTAILNEIEKDFSSSCPRCGGSMNHHKIRCGPEKLVSVNKCQLCNYWIPQHQHAVA